MASSPDKEHDFFEILAGHGKGHPTAEAMRDALQDEANTIKEAESAQPEKLPDYEIARLDAVKKQLIQSGVFKQNSRNEPSWLRKFFDLFTFNFASKNWGAGFAVTAGIVVVSAIMLQQPKTDIGFDPEAIRGVNGMVITSNQPNETVEKLKTTLTNAGAEVVVAQINDAEWTLEISVSDKTKLEAVKGLLAKAGLKVSGEPPYQVSVKKENVS